jgi:hypothetical protein
MNIVLSNTGYRVAALALSAVSLAVFTPATHANLQVQFAESAPKDRFSFSNLGVCSLKDVVLTIDLAQTRGKLIFDTTATGAGVEVYQPFETSSSTVKLVGSSSVADGETSLTIGIDTIGTGEIVSFTIDVDDTLPQSQLGMIRVTGSEMQGAKVTVSAQGLPVSSTMFGASSSTVLELPEC